MRRTWFKIISWVISDTMSYDDYTRFFTLIMISEFNLAIKFSVVCLHINSPENAWSDMSSRMLYLPFHCMMFLQCILTGSCKNVKSEAICNLRGPILTAENTSGLMSKVWTFFFDHTLIVVSDLSACTKKKKDFE